MERSHVVLLMLFSDSKTGANIGWYAGRVQKYAPMRVRFNYDIMWDEGVRGANLSLDVYYNHEVAIASGETPVAVAWVFMKRDN